MENKGFSVQEALKKVEIALQQIRYGEITIKVQNGKPIFVDKHERERIG